MAARSNEGILKTGQRELLSSKAQRAPKSREKGLAAVSAEGTHLNLLNSIVGNIEVAQDSAAQAEQWLQGLYLVVGQLQSLQGCEVFQCRNLRVHRAVCLQE